MNNVLEMAVLEKYIRQFARLRRAPGHAWNEATRKQAPHKPLLLMAVLDLVARGVITSSFIDVTGDLVELNELFTGYWRRVVPITQKSSIAFPFSRLHNEPFWELVPVSGREITREAINNITSVSQLRELALGARMDDDLFLLLQSPENRMALRQVLLQSCFSEEAQRALQEQAQINSEAFSYNLELVQMAHQPRVKEILEGEKYKKLARDQGFRRAVVTSYDHRCALCGVRIVTSEGHTVVDAAHIVPWSVNRNDDIRNGMALCKLCHWAFDEGMMGVSESYSVITSRQIGADPNVPGFLLTLSGRGIIPPTDRELWPERKHLKWHRVKWRL
ncbi:MAG: HNH endonuclease [Geobacteraceae bacterium]|nr:HNH endonuclease [Geobacteraceae bacterium]